MSRTAARITQADVARAIRAAKQAVPNDTFIYFLRAGPFVKIGQSRTWKVRRQQMQVGSPYDIVPILVLIAAPSLEKELHRKFSRDHYRGEWFHMSERISAYVRSRQTDSVANSPNADLRGLKIEVEREVIL